ncbi:MAG: hypothetical protein CL610_03645 [Anaerolineaceae bacterium]|nr:hypothetical protein [Anaerolineaceae bacterium]
MATSDVFISYRRKDVEFVKQLAGSLAQQQRDVWVDWEDIPPGVSDFSREIARGIESAHTFLVVLSPDYLESEYCLHELEYADQLNKRMLPIVFRPVDAEQVPACIRSINWVYFVPHAGQSNDFSAAFQAVCQAIDTDYDHVREHTRLLARALDWENNQQNASFLLSGAELDAAESWLATAASHTPPPTDVQTDFILRSRQSQTRRQRQLLGGALVLLALAVVGLIVAVVAGVEARQQQMIAERRAAETLSLSAANAAVDAAASGEYLDGLRLAHFAATYIDNPPEQAQQTLRQLAFQPGTRYAYFDDLPPDMNVLGIKPGQSVRSSGQSDTILVSDDEETFTIRDADNQPIMDLNRLIGSAFMGYMGISEDIHPAVLSAYENPLVSSPAMDITPDRDYVAVGTEQGLVIVQNTDSASEYWRPDGHTLPVDGVRFSTDGRYLASRASSDTLNDMSISDREFIVWDTESWEPVLQFDNFRQQRDLVAVSDDGLHLLFLEQSPPGYTLWDVRDSRQQWQLREGQLIMDVAFNPDGNYLVAANLFTLRMRPPRDFHIYDTDGQLINSLTGQPGVDALDMPILFSPDGVKLRQIRDDGDLVEVDILTGETTRIGRVPQPYILGSSMNGRFVGLQDYDNSEVLIWDVDDAAEVARFSSADLGFTLTVSNDGRYVAYDAREAGETVGLVVRDLMDMTAAVARFGDLAADIGIVGTITHAFGPDAQVLVYASTSGDLRVIEMDTWQEQTILRGLADRVSDITVSADGQRVAAAGESGTVMIWDVVSGSDEQRITNAGAVPKVAFAPDGESLMIGDEQGNIALWRFAGSSDVLAWVEQNRALVPLTCADLIQAGLIASPENCPVAP